MENAVPLVEASGRIGSAIAASSGLQGFTEMLEATISNAGGRGES
jgi:hypothetical protein